MELSIYSIFFFLIPFATIAFFVVSLCNYISAKKNFKLEQTEENGAEVKKSRVMLIVSSVIMGVLLAIVISFMALMFVAVAYM